MLIVYKPIGCTMVQLIDDLKNKHPVYKGKKISYAGRLDPMAHGLVILLVEDECKNQEHYIAETKKYRFQILLGFKTDTYDLLGIPNITDDINSSDKITTDNIITQFESHLGDSEQVYPNFSSFVAKSIKTGERKPLWKWTKESRLNEINIPSKTIHINSLIVNRIYNLNTEDLNHIIINKLNKLNDPNNEFRKKDILTHWNHILSKRNKFYRIIEVEALVSSGTYIRSLTNTVGEQLGCGAIAFDINRIKIGNYDDVTLSL